MVSEFFIPIYEANLARQKKPFSAIQTEADMNFYEREFIDWLRNKFGKKLSALTYPTYCTQKYFQLFISGFKSIQNKTEFKNKKEAIYQQLLQDSKFPPITKHEYDVDIVETYFRIKQLLETEFSEDPHKLNKDYLIRFLYPIQFYCKENEMPFDRVMQSKYPIIINNGNYNFEAFLGRTLIACDIHKIEAILTYQNAKWRKEGIFPSFVEHLVYSFVLHNSLINKNERLSKIMNWVGNHRTYIAVDESVETPMPEKKTVEQNTSKENTSPALSETAKKKQKNKRKKVKSKPDTPKEAFGVETIDLKKFDYWPYPEDKLTLLYKFLVEENKIEETKYFSELFTTHVNITKTPIVWKTANIQLMYLLHLIYKKDPQFKSWPLQTIAITLFTSNQRNFDSKGLNTSLLHAKEYENTKKKMSPGIRSIKNIYDRLELEVSISL